MGKYEFSIAIHIEILYISRATLFLTRHEKKSDNPERIERGSRS